MNFFNGSCRSATIHGIQCVQLFVNTHRTHIVAVHEKSYSIRRTPADFFDYLGLLVDTTLNIVRFANRRNAIALLSRSNVHRNFRIRISTDRTIRIAPVRLRQVNLSIYLSLFFVFSFPFYVKPAFVCSVRHNKLRPGIESNYDIGFDLRNCYENWTDFIFCLVSISLTSFQNWYQIGSVTVLQRLYKFNEKWDFSWILMEECVSSVWNWTIWRYKIEK